MVRFLSTSFILICCCAYLVASSFDYYGDSSTEKSSTSSSSGKVSSTKKPPPTKPTPKPVECNREDINKIVNCCKLPQVFPAGLIENCSYTMPTPKPTKPPKGNSKRTKRAPPKGSKPNPPTCIADCLLKSQGLISDTGEININGLINLINSNASEIWLPS
ncbi:uncharacterized protein LOC132197114 [Neocloeon triangulifer]|uniref:uncharacterized protein LOC132197114 n=1 Tax=Neocloeon triangulifer TaxID=2078957 RepID=UPI00286F3007|nr:uncharacterized protein LOC132197114 [Neocloeon triangulifer]